MTAMRQHVEAEGPANDASTLRVWIDYNFPSSGIGRWLGAMAARMVRNAERNIA